MWESRGLLQNILNDRTSHSSRKLVGGRCNLTGIIDNQGLPDRQGEQGGCGTKKGRVDVESPALTGGDRQGRWEEIGGGGDGKR